MGKPEAQAAAHLARELMARYGVTIKDLGPEPGAKKAARGGGVTNRPIKSGPKSPPAAESVTVTIKLGGMRFRWRL